MLAKLSLFNGSQECSQINFGLILDPTSVSKSIKKWSSLYNKSGAHGRPDVTLFFCRVVVISLGDMCILRSLNTITNQCMCCMFVMNRVFCSCLKLVTVWCHVGLKSHWNCIRNQTQYGTEVRVSFDVDMCPLPYRCWSNLKPILESKWMQLGICGASAVNLEDFLES